jgi:murein L,D-transpeptidase YafK
MKILIFISIFMIQQTPFKESQLKNSRVKVAYEEKEQVVKVYFTQKSVDYKGFQLFLRAFKKEQVLEVWVKGHQKENFTLLHQYPFCSSSGVLGPKRREGDLQIPEGIYHINHFNPASNFYLSLGVSYPNASDRILSDAKHPGGAIYVHGNCVTIGCIPITDEYIKELYVMAVEAKNNGQQKIPIHIYPARLDEKGMQNLKTNYAAQPELIRFWENLRPVFQYFETNRKLSVVKVNAKGLYY